MKLIIDIPDNEYRNIKEYYEKNDIVEAIYSYIIYHGIPLNEVLDKIRTEIKLKEKTLTDKYRQQKYGVWTDDVLKIIDKYTKGDINAKTN